MSVQLNTKSYWDSRYVAGGTSGAGSYGDLARYKAKFLNQFVAKNRIGSVSELGCGDGAQLSRARYAHYIGYDISPKAVQICKEIYKNDISKSFFCLSDISSLTPSDLGLSLDVIYHLLEDDIYKEYIAQLFRLATRFVIIYGNGCIRDYPDAHVKLRDFCNYIEHNFPQWTLIDGERNPYYSEKGNDPTRSWSNFYVFELQTDSLQSSLFKSFYQKKSKPNLLSLASALDPVKPGCSQTEYWRNMIDRNPREEILYMESNVSRHETDALINFGIDNFYIKEVLPEVAASLGDVNAKDVFFRLMHQPKLIVSLTTIKQRLSSLELVLETILRQSKQPDSIILSISEDPYLLDEGIDKSEIPASLVSLQNSGLLEIKFVSNLGPYRKLVPALSENKTSNCVIVTIDDDTLYPPFWLDEMFNTHLKYPKSIIARRATRLAFREKTLLPYNSWVEAPIDPDIKREMVDMLLVPTGKDGVLYRPDFFDDLVFEPDLYLAAPTSDDLALRLLTISKGVPVRLLPRRLSTSGIAEEYETLDHSRDGLWTRKNSKGGNDENLRNALSFLKNRIGFDISVIFE